MIPVLTKTSFFSSDTYFWNGVLGFAAFLAVIALSYFALRWLSKRTVGVSSRHMRVIERLAVGQGTFLMLVRVGERVLALSATKDGLKFLCELSPSDIGDAEAPVRENVRESDPGSLTFGRRFAHNMRIQLGLLPKDTPPARPAAVAERPPEIADGYTAPSVEPLAEERLGAFALELQKAQNSENNRRENEDLLLSLLSQNDSNPIPVPKAAPDSGRGAFTDYNTVIESMKQLGRVEKNEPITPVSPRAAAASYKASASVPRPEPAPVSPPAPKPEPAPVPPPAPKPEPASDPAPSARLRTEREQAAQKLQSNDDKVDELFDRISQRSSRYKKE